LLCTFCFCRVYVSGISSCPVHPVFFFSLNKSVQFSSVQITRDELVAGWCRDSWPRRKRSLKWVQCRYVTGLQEDNDDQLLIFTNREYGAVMLPFSSVTVSVFVRARVCNALTFESLYLERSFLVCMYIFRISSSNSYQGNRTKVKKVPGAKKRVLDLSCSISNALLCNVHFWCVKMYTFGIISSATSDASRFRGVCSLTRLGRESLMTSLQAELKVYGF